MKLNPMQIQRAGWWLMNRAPSLRCPGCGANDWHVDENVYLLASPPVEPVKGITVARNVGQLNVPPPATVSPCITVVCAHCANVQLFGAKAMGLFGPAPDPEKVNDGSKGT